MCETRGNNQEWTHGGRQRSKVQACISTKLKDF